MNREAESLTVQVNLNKMAKKMVIYLILISIKINFVREENNFPSALPGSQLRPPCNKRQINRKKANRSLINMMPTVCMGET